MSMHHLAPLPVRLLLLACLACSAPAAHGGDEVRFYDGEVMVDVSLDGWVFVALDEAPGDGAADRVLALQREPVSTESLVGPVRSTGRVMRRPYSVVVQIDEPAWRLVLHLPEDEPDRLRRAHLGGQRGVPAARTDVLTGYGLIEYPGPFTGGESLEDSLRLIVSTSGRTRGGGISRTWAAEEPPGGPEGGGSSGSVDCDAGGCGSTECSVSGCIGQPDSCSVTCTGDTFSCCRCQTVKAACECGRNSEC